MQPFIVHFSDGDSQLVHGHDKTHARQKAAMLKGIADQGVDGLGRAYMPIDSSCFVMDVEVPDTMATETQIALERIKEWVNGDIKGFLVERLQYTSEVELCKAFSAEQMDGVLMAIYNIEQRRQGMIIGDQTGIGKGRQAAAIIRYGVIRGIKPVFLSEKANLFSDMYRDLVDIGSGDLVPFIVNSDSRESRVVSEAGKVIHRPPPSLQQKAVIASASMEGYDFVMATYSQFQSNTMTDKKLFLSRISGNNLFILDEAHNASGASNTGRFMRSILASAAGCLFLSATYAKRPDNMPLYAAKSAMQDAGMEDEALVNAIANGGEALQEVLSAMLVQEGQLLRRQRGFGDVQVNYLSLDHKQVEHAAASDTITNLMANIIEFQQKYVDPEIKKKDKAAAQKGSEVEQEKGVQKGGVTNTPIFSRMFNMVNQLLFAIKAEDVAERAIKRLEEGKAVVIAFGSTMESAINEYATEETIPTDFSKVMERMLYGTLRYSETNSVGEKERKTLSPSELGMQGQIAFEELVDKIKSSFTSLLLSPIDLVTDIIEEQGYRVGEVTGRGRKIEYKGDRSEGIVKPRSKEPKTALFNKFNRNELDVLLLNQSGATGASAHAKPNDAVPAHEVRQRCMIILQAELNINLEIQKRGRINRTGQILPPIYDYVNSTIPAESRLMMMLKAKLKSLDANTTSSQKSSDNQLKSQDFLNKYGDKVCFSALMFDSQFEGVADTLNLSEDNLDQPDLAKKLTGRMALLPVERQRRLFDTITESYQTYIDDLKAKGEYDLEVEELDLEATTLNKEVFDLGNGDASLFGSTVFIEECEVNLLRKPYTATEVENFINNYTDAGDPGNYQMVLSAYNEAFWDGRYKREEALAQQRYQNAVDDPDASRAFQSILKSKNGDRESALEAFLFDAKIKLNDRLDRAKFKNQSYYKTVNKYIEGFRPGDSFNITDENGESIPAVMLGFKVNMEAEDAFLPSQIKIHIALANGDKTILRALSSPNLAQAMGVAFIRKGEPYDHVRRWNELTAEFAGKKRTKATILTGNMLKASGQLRGEMGGRLISFTTSNGQVRKGVMVNSTKTDGSRVGGEVSVPINRATKIIASLTPGANIGATPISFVKSSDNNSISIYIEANTKTRKYYQHEPLYSLMEDGQFFKVGNRMAGKVRVEDLQAPLDVLTRDFQHSLTITRAQYEMIKDEVSDLVHDVEMVDSTTNPAPEPVPANTAETTPPPDSTPAYEEATEGEFSDDDDDELEFMRLEADAKIKIALALEV